MKLKIITILSLTILIMFNSKIFSQENKINLLIKDYQIITQNKNLDKLIFFSINKKENSDNLVQVIKSFNGVKDIKTKIDNNNVTYTLKVNKDFTINNLSSLFKKININQICINDICTDIKYFKLVDGNNFPKIGEYKNAGIYNTTDHYNSIIEQIRYKIYFYQTSEYNLSIALINGTFNSYDKHLNNALNNIKKLKNN